jgi:hypothetical protein
VGAATVENCVYLFGGYSESVAKLSTINMFSKDCIIALQEAYLRRGGKWVQM